MFHLPAPPNTRVTRQVECVSCKEVFTIAEDDFRAAGQPTRSWRLPPDQNSTTVLRYNADRRQRAVTSEPRAQPSVNPEDYVSWNGQTLLHLNCPRCGADNRNWLWIQNPPAAALINPDQVKFNQNMDYILIGMSIFLSMIAVVLAVHSFFTGSVSTSLVYAFLGVGLLFLTLIVARTAHQILPLSYRQWRSRFPLAEKSFLITLVLAFIATILGVASNVPVGKLLILLLFMIFTSLATAQKMTQTWREYRENQLLRTIAPATPDQGLRLLLWGVGLILFTAFIVPVLFFRFAPMSFAYMSEKTAVNNENKKVLAGADASMARLQDNMITAPLEIRQAIDLLYSWEEQGFTIPYANTPQFLITIETAKNLGRITERTAAELEQYVLTHNQQLTEMERNTNEWITQSGRNILNEAYKDLAADTRFMVLWGISVGLACVMTVLLSTDALNSYVRELNGRLPPPLFTSIANMTRVVAWEMKRSLEIDYDLNQIEWTKATRNPDGGITLLGVQWDPAMYDEDGRVKQALVFTRNYKVITNSWGRVLDVEVEVQRVRVPPISPGGSRHGQVPTSLDVANEFFSVVSAQPVARNPQP